MTPDCMTAEELALWRTSPYAKGWSNPCMDCPLAWAKEQREKGCCNGTPGKAVDDRPFMRVGRPWKHPSDDVRVAARRRSWREAKSRVRARQNAEPA